MLDNLYADIGAKIKNWAKWIFIIGSISAIIGGIGLMDDDVVFIGFIVLFCGPLVAWVSSWILYAFGQLVEDVHAIRNKEGTAEEVKAKRETEENLRQQAVEKAKREKEEEKIRKYIAEEEAKREKDKQQAANARKRVSENSPLKITPSGTGYICPVCKTINASFSPCTNCQYDPQIILNESNGLTDEDYIDVTCPACKETLSFLTSEKNTNCPYCGKQIILK